MQQIIIEDLTIDVLRKKIKNIYLRVNTVTGKIHVSAPIKLSETFIMKFLHSKMEWIKNRMQQTIAQPQPTEYLFVNGEEHYYLGKKFKLNVITGKHRGKVMLNGEYIDLYAPLAADSVQCEKILDRWYRQRLILLAMQMMLKWHETIGVNIAALHIKKMKTKWGTCNTNKQRIWLSLALAKKPINCIEYVVVHEMVHLLERHHNKRFYAYMDRFLPNWRQNKNELNSLKTTLPTH